MNGWTGLQTYVQQSGATLSPIAYRLIPIAFFMSLTDLSIRRPAFITSIMAVIITVGLICFDKMNVDLFPNIEIPTIFVSTTYTGASPSEIESLITKPLEEQVSTGSGIKKVTSRSLKDTRSEERRVGKECC